jgi:hypothetical protein
MEYEIKACSTYGAVEGTSLMAWPLTLDKMDRGFNSAVQLYPRYDA